MEPLATPTAAPPPTLGRYELLSVLGRGGMANVYLGRHAGASGFQRLFAIKVLHPHLAEEEAFVEMLLDEAHIAARLHHPNVVPIVDLGTQDGIHYVVMEYVEGCTLSALLKKNRDERPPRLLIPIILDALSGLHAAHSLTDEDGASLKLVHRDVSPQNILVGVDGMARLTDFGIAKAESRINSTRPGELKGKISFMSPEQIRHPESVDHRSDVFSAGVLLWTALTGRQLFDSDSSGSSGAALNNTLRMVVERPSQVGLRPPAVFDAICMRALERNVATRLDSALAFEESLRSAAMANGLCGSRREVGEWVLDAVGEELAERRSNSRSSGNQRVARRHSPAGGIGAITDSRFKVDPALIDDAALAEPISIVSTVSSVSSVSSVSNVTVAARDSAPVIESAPISTRELENEGRGRKRWLLIAGGLALAVGLVWGGTHLGAALSSSPPSASTPAQPSIAATGSAAATPPEAKALPAVAAEQAKAQPAAAVVSAPAALERAELARRRAPQTAVRRSPSTAAQLVANAPAPAPVPAAVSNETRPKKPTWDEDSPLPHP